MRRVPRGSSTTRPGPLEQPQVARDRRPADRQRVGELLDRPPAGPEQLDDRPPVRVAERVERIARRRGAARGPEPRAYSARILLFFASWVTSASPSASRSGGM